MARLNMKIREAIVVNAVKASNYDAQIASLVKDRIVWVEKVRLGGMPNGLADSLDATYQAALKLLEGTPEQYLSISRTRHYHMSVNVAGHQIRAYFSGHFGDRKCLKNVTKCAPYNVTLLANDPLVGQFAQLEKRAAKAKAYREGIRHHVRAMVASVTTVEKLIAAWPEAAELIPKEEAVAAPFPALRIDDLNAMIGLPSGGE